MATQLRSFQIADGAIGTNHLATGGVTTAKLADSSVSTAKIAAGAVTQAKLASASVGTDQLIDANVTEGKLADGAVATAKIAADAVTTAKILDGNITTAKLADANVTTAKLSDDAVTQAKLADNSVGTAQIIDANVTTAKIAAGAVTAAKIAANAVGASQLADDAVDGAAIQSGVITESHLSSAVAAKLNNTLSRKLDATADPSANDDASNTAGATWSYGTAAMVGSMWINTTSGETFRCVDATAGAAVWVQTSIDSTELSDLAFINQSALETTINIAISRVTGLQDALNLKADDADVLHKTGDETSSGEKTFNGAIVANGGVTGNVTGQVSDVSNHLTTLTVGAEDKYVDGAELKAKFDEQQSQIDALALDFSTEQEYFDGNGSATSFTYGLGNDTNLMVFVFRNGQKLKPVEDYTDNGAAITFSDAPVIGEVIEVSRIYRP